MNYRFLLQYDGTDFHGWQTQGEFRTVQNELVRALSLLDDREVIVNGSGRTDAGVHAEGQVANAQLQREMSPEKLRAAMNGNLPADVRVLFVSPASDEFHARYSAKRKTYVYRIVHGQVMSPFWSRYAIHEARALDLDRMSNCASLFVGEHDWTAFSAARTDVESRVRTISSLEIDEGWDARGRCHLIRIAVTADGFLRYMVRSIAGTLLAAARAETDEETIIRALRDGDRSLACATAPARGLTLMRVRYD